jgi:CDP-diacylglycerol--glycerol-3-phosphate 3-phosphatidyltransferase
VDQLAGKKTEALSFTDQMRVVFKGVLDPIAALLNRLGLTPNTITLLGLIGTTIGAYFLMRGQMTLGGLIIFIMGPVDALDGAMARLRGEPSIFGAFVDSVSDRYAELAIFGGLVLYYSAVGDWLGVVLAYFSAAGSILVSYTRARAQSLGIETKVGILTRMERYMVLGPALIFNIPLIGLWILAIFTNLTAVQRILDVRRQFHQQMKKPGSTNQAG